MPENKPALEDASRRLAASIGDDLYWFTEGDKRNFIDPVTGSTLACLLLTTFLKSAAAAAGAAAGKLVWDATIHAIRDAIAGKSKPVASALQAETDAACSTLDSLPKTARDAALDEAKESLLDALKRNIPPNFAASMVDRIKQTASSMLGGP